MEQLNIFECFNLGKTKLKFYKPIRIVELFAGIGAQAASFERLQEDGLLPYGFEVASICEFDKYAVKSYNAIHGSNFQVSDITQIHASDLNIKDTDKYQYVMTYSFPCQDLSNSGKQRGMAKGTGTRSGLLWEVERLLNECEELPQILLMENVPEVAGAKNMPDFRKWMEFLESKGYTNCYEFLNAKDFGVPQNRERCFMVSFLGSHYYKFPQGFQLEKRLKDVLEEKVDEKYYLSGKAVKGLVSQMDFSTLPLS